MDDRRIFHFFTEGKTLSVVLDGQFKPLFLHLQPDEDFRGAGMFYGVVQRFLEGQEDVVPQLGSEMPFGQLQRQGENAL